MAGGLRATFVVLCCARPSKIREVPTPLVLRRRLPQLLLSSGDDLHISKNNAQRLIADNTTLSRQQAANPVSNWYQTGQHQTEIDPQQPSLRQSPGDGRILVCLRYS